MVDRAQWLIVRVNGGGRGTGVEPSPRSPGYSSELRRTWFLAKAEGAPPPQVDRKRPSPAGGRPAQSVLDGIRSLFRPTHLQPDFRTRKSSRSRLTQALVKPDIDSLGFASNGRGTLTLRCGACCPWEQRSSFLAQPLQVGPRAIATR
jgi:hypothetical protein